ncbi:MAG: hypothetical protein ACJ76A_06510 [Actinomycetota bacterium]
MDKQLPAFDQVVALLGSPKPPLICRVIELEGGIEKRSARVIFDGQSGWFIEEGERIELRSTDERVLLDEGGFLRCLPPRAHVNAWVKTPIQGDRMSLDQTTGRVVGREEVDGRTAVVTEFAGLRSGDDSVLVLFVDVETGVVLQMSSEDGGVILRLEDLRVCTVQDPLGT